jgi:hypothetical protein
MGRGLKKAHVTRFKNINIHNYNSRGTQCHDNALKFHYANYNTNNLTKFIILFGFINLSITY